MQPLAGIQVIDFSTLLPGPLASLFLAKAGAEVVKIERPDIGDEMRTYEPRLGADSANFTLLNRGKRSVAIDLKAPDALVRLTPLLKRADVLIEQFRPGVMERLGLSYDAVRAINDQIIYCSITGFGQCGPRHGMAGRAPYQPEDGKSARSHSTASAARWRGRDYRIEIPVCCGACGASWQKADILIALANVR